MMPMEPNRFEEGRAMLLAGVRRVHSFDEVDRGIREQWEALRALGTLPGQQGTTAYGVICGASPEAGTLEFMCGVEVASFDALPPGLGRMRVPAVRYAVFVHDGPVATLRATWQAIFEGWLPRSGYVSAQTPDFEVYDGADPRAGSARVELWVGVKPG
jgi:AraC family transcriptional regulator